jgi:fibro-slime domain-containing protein
VPSLRQSLSLILLLGIPSALLACGPSDSPSSEPAPSGPRDIDEDGSPGGYELGDEVDGDSSSNDPAEAGTCDPKSILLKAVVRDFKAAGDPDGHPDFETFGGGTATWGLVEESLGPDRKPVYTGLCSEPGMTESCPNDQQMTDEESFDQWYRDTPDVNLAYEVILSLDPTPEGLRFESGEFFPVDGAGFGDQGRGRNYHFTTEVHTEFEYQGGEIFTFMGDDDVWIFVNGKLAVDLGGLHGELSGTVDLDASAGELELEKGETYPFDLFHAERHTLESRFRMDTNFHFTQCGTRVQD